MEEKKISIIIPAYNVEKYIAKCLHSVINQSYKNLDVIVVDDGSKDRTGCIIDDYSAKDNRIRAVHQPNGGLPNARNTGMKYANGDYVMFLDSDDWIEPTCCEVIVSEMQKDKADLVFFEYYKEYKNKTVQMKTYPHEKLIYNRDGGKQEFFLYDMRTITAWGKIYSAEILHKCEYNESLRTAEDVILLLICFLLAVYRTVFKDKIAGYTFFVLTIVVLIYTQPMTVVSLTCSWVFLVFTTVLGCESIKDGNEAV